MLIELTIIEPTNTWRSMLRMLLMNGENIKVMTQKSIVNLFNNEETTLP
jgi:hypothetical protein